MSESHYNIGFTGTELKLFEKWYIKAYGPSEDKPPEAEQILYRKAVVLRENEEWLESLEHEDE